MVMGVSLTTVGSIVLAVVFAVSLDGCSRVAAGIKPHVVSAATVETR
jgi:hypothetical protein